MVLEWSTLARGRLIIIKEFLKKCQYNWQERCKIDNLLEKKKIVCKKWERKSKKLIGLFLRGSGMAGPDSRSYQMNVSAGENPQQRLKSEENLPNNLRILFLNQVAGCYTTWYQNQWLKSKIHKYPSSIQKTSGIAKSSWKSRYLFRTPGDHSNYQFPIVLASTSTSPLTSMQMTDILYFSNLRTRPC